MTGISRRAFLYSAAAGTAATGTAAGRAGHHSLPRLKSLTSAAVPISGKEIEGRLARVQQLMQQRKIAGLLVEAGSSLEYLTGIRWWRSERTTAALIPADGEVVVITPHFEEPSVRETLKVRGEVRAWHEDESPFELLAAAVRGRASAAGPLAIEPTTRYFIVRGLTMALAGERELAAAEDLVASCRAIKSPAEIALLQLANEVTLAALRHVHAQIEAGMRAEDIGQLMSAATEALGGSHEFSLVLLNEASAYPHGSHSPQQVRRGSVILIDSGCAVQGYQSDISRTWIFGEPNARQQELWETVKRGQELALETARIDAPVGDIDRAVRAFYEGKGWRPDYGLPGLSHRTGHGIGMDVHEPPYLVRSDRSALRAGMCFSDEPGLYVPGEFGVRLEDCWYMTASGPKLFTPLARSLEQPI